MIKIFIVAILSFGSSMVLAKGDGPCAKDREALCGGIEPGEGRMMKCMKDNEEKLSSECKAHRSERKEAMKGIHEACHEDMEKFCSSEKKGRDRMKCMKKHKDEFSTSCKEEMAKHKKDRG
jgi:hypothetical protein